jgi:hypothetical protein
MADSGEGLLLEGSASRSSRSLRCKSVASGFELLGTTELDGKDRGWTKEKGV